MDGWVDQWIDEWVDVWLDRQMDGEKQVKSLCHVTKLPIFYVCSVIIK
jgi:hypothetical protein